MILFDFLLHAVLYPQSKQKKLASPHFLFNDSQRRLVWRKLPTACCLRFFLPPDSALRISADNRALAAFTRILMSTPASAIMPCKNCVASVVFSNGESFSVGKLRGLPAPGLAPPLATVVPLVDCFRKAVFAGSVDQPPAP